MKQGQSIEEFRNDLKRMSARTHELERQLANCANGKLPEDARLDPSMIMISSMVASLTGEPMVMLRWFTHVAQITADQARELAFDLIDVAEAAKSDAFLMQFMSKLTGRPNAGMAVIAEFREFRWQQAGKTSEKER